MKRVLIIGSSGMLGCDLSRELRKSYVVWGADVVRSPRSMVHGFIKCDISDRGCVRTMIKKVRPDIVIHAAAWTDVDSCEKDPRKAYRINRDGTENVAVACKKYNATLLYISTDFVFNGKKNTPYKESDKPGPLGVYADSKLQGERAVRANIKDHIIVRTSWLYGKCGNNFVDTIIAKAATEPVLKVVDDQVGSPTYTKDLAKALHALIDKIFSINNKRKTINAQSIYHISNSGAVSWFDYAKTILRTSHLKTKVEPISSLELGRPAKRPAMSALDCSKFTKLTGFKMRNWKSIKEY